MILNPISVVQFFLSQKTKEITFSHWVIIFFVLGGVGLEQLNANAQAQILENHTFKLGELGSLTISMNDQIKEMGNDLDNLVVLTTNIQVKNTEQDKRLDEIEKKNKEQDERLKKLEEEKDDKDDDENDN